MTMAPVNHDDIPGAVYADIEPESGTIYFAGSSREVHQPRVAGLPAWTGIVRIQGIRNPDGLVQRGVMIGDDMLTPETARRYGDALLAAVAEIIQDLHRDAPQNDAPVFSAVER